jgi:hypothetical protein
MAEGVIEFKGRCQREREEKRSREAKLGEGRSGENERWQK